jgi:uncharacterized protein YecE (DUF72 family)
MIKIGTSGYSFADWKGTVYPKTLTPANMLYYYENEIGFDTVEINYTYYRQPTARSMANMVRNTHRDFQFTVKAYKEMTHEIWAVDHKLKDNKDIFKEFLDGIEPLAVNNKLGCVLAQFPVMFERGAPALDYLEIFRERMGNLPVVIEFRHCSWVGEDTYRWLDANQLGFCIVDEPRLPRLMPLVEEATGDLGYFRFHGRNPRWFNVPASERYNYLYNDKELSEFIPKIKNIAAKTKTTFVFFNNCHGGQAVKNAKKLMDLMGIESNDGKLI